MENELVEALGKIFQNVDSEHRDQLMAWAAEELGTRPVITLCENESGIVWKVSEPSPSMENSVVFAMLMDDDRRAVHVYCAAFVEQDGKEGTLFYKETIWKPRHTWGPLSIQALWNEWSAYFTDGGDEPEPENLNGAAATAGR